MSTNLLKNTCKLEWSTTVIKTNVEVVCMIMLYLYMDTYTSSGAFFFSPLQECWSVDVGVRVVDVDKMFTVSMNAKHSSKCRGSI